MSWCVYTASTLQSVELLEQLCQTVRNQTSTVVHHYASPLPGSVWQCVAVETEEEGHREADADGEGGKGSNMKLVTQLGEGAVCRLVCYSA